MHIITGKILACMIVGAGVLFAPASLYAQEDAVVGVSAQAAQPEGVAAEPEQGAQPEGVAAESERAPQSAVGEEGAIAVYPGDMEEGEYEIEVESSSSMFRIVKAVLNVKDGKMQARITLGGTGYLRLYMGSGEEALQADASEYAEYEEDQDGSYSYTIPVEALNKPLLCTGFSKRKEKWYDHEIFFDASTLPEGVCKNQPADGQYTVEVTLDGGTGKATVESPAKLHVEEGHAFARILWSSPHYDYMIVGGKTYTPESTEGNSLFVIPVSCFDHPMEVIADTTAMSQPHEIEYTLEFSYESLKEERMSATVSAEEEGVSADMAEDGTADRAATSVEGEAAPAEAPASEAEEKGSLFSGPVGALIICFGISLVAAFFMSRGRRK